MNKKMVNEVSNYLRQRRFFPKGIFWLHGTSTCFRKHFEEMCGELSKLKKDNKRKNQKMKKQKSLGCYNPPRDNCLIVIDKRCQDVKDIESNLLALYHNINEIQK
jgi:hypothetical protein